jgi:hypothetical protein
MGKQYPEITEALKEWIESQKIFFIATAPLSAEGHINCSPKGLDSFRVMGPNRVVYQDLTGSGIETVAHLKENGRVVIMFCAFEGPPKIVRLHGRGEVIEPGHPEYELMNSLFPQRIGMRAYIVVNVSRIADSCGYSIPLYEFQKERDVLDKLCMNKGEEGLKVYRAEKNRESIDGITGLEQQTD